MTLKDRIAARIRQGGPVSIADYMADCLTHPELGYYTTRDPLGAAGDFTTAPEISQMFGEVLGLALAGVWAVQSSPAPFALVEFGPGRGTLMADALRATRAVPGFHEAMTLYLVEASPALRTAQAEQLAGYRPRWVDDTGSLPDMPLFAVANEFFDALPIRQFLRAGSGWRERLVGLEPGGTLAFGLGPAGPQPALAHRLGDTRDGDLVETGAAGAAILTGLSSQIAKRGGAALIVDYGDWRSLGDTLQALKAHEPAGILDDPGSADLTAHVDFEALAQAANNSGCRHSRLTPQGVFLERLGITDRAQALAKAAGRGGAGALAAAHRRLTHPQEMGNLFKVLGVFPRGTAPPPGLLP